MGKVEKSVNQGIESDSRRRFLKMTAVLAGALLGNKLLSNVGFLKKINGLAINIETDDLESARSKLELLRIEKVNTMLDFLNNKYGVEIYNGETAIIRYFLNNLENAEDIGLHEKLSIQELEVELDHIVAEIIKYPTDFFRKNKVKRIRIVKDLARVHNFTKKDSGLMGQVIHPHQFILTSSEASNFSSLNNEEQAMWKTIIFHHELFHDLQLRLKSLKSIQEYNNLYKNDTQSTVVRSDYNLNLLEDMANLAGYLMHPKSHKIFLQKISEIQNLEEKNQLQGKYDLIKNIYYDLSDGLMDEVYWDDLLNGRIIPYRDGEHVIDQYWIDKT